MRTLPVVKRHTTTKRTLHCTARAEKMKHQMLGILLLLLLVLLGRGAIISQSSIKDCTWGDSSEPKSPNGTLCSKKMLISMVLGSGKENTESLHANVGKAYEEGNTEMSVLKKPFRIELRKTAVVASYRAYLLGTANALPQETTISKKGAVSFKTGFLKVKGTCVEDFYANPKDLPCGIQFHGETEERVWDSQGFCCKCFSGFEAKKNVRGGHSCDLGNLIQKRMSAHCMKMDDLWYDVFSVEMPMMQYKITLDVLELQGIVVNNVTGSRHVDWKLISTFHLGPSRTIGRSKDGRVIAELQGSLVGSQAVKDLSHKSLLIPSVRMWPKGKPYPAAYANGPNDWMLVDTSMVQLLGTECNKIGVSYTGFRRQSGKCHAEQGSCFHNQPLQLWEHDDELRKKKESGHYMIHNFGKVHSDSHPNNHSFILKFFHEDLHNSFVTLRIDASDITFVRSISSGRIVETYTVPFTAAVGHGSLTVEVGNTGEVLSEYSVSVTKCTDGLHDIAAKTLSLNPGEVKNTSFTLRSGDTDGGDKKCEVQLYDSNFNLLDTAMIDIKVGAACMCFGICGCVCEDDDGVKSQAQCPEAGPPTIYKSGPIALILFLMVLESIGAHGFIAFFASICLILGFIKLAFGSVICCRKTKAQEYTEKMIEKGVPPKSPLLVQCSGECRGATAARARYERKVKRLRAAGKSPHRLDDWRNTSFECQCKSELTDIRMIHVVRAVCFFYFCCLLPFIWLGRWVMWRFLRDTGENMARAEQQVLMRAKKKGKLDKYGIVDIATELKKMEEKSEKAQKENEEQKSIVEALAMNIDYTSSKSDETNDLKEEEAQKPKEKGKKKKKEKDSEGDKTSQEENQKDQGKEVGEADEREINDEHEIQKEASLEESATIAAEEVNTVGPPTAANIPSAVTESDRENHLKDQDTLETEKGEEKEALSQETAMQQQDLEGKKKSKDKRKEALVDRPVDAEKVKQADASPKPRKKEMAVERVAQSEGNNLTKKSPKAEKQLRKRLDKVEAGQDRDRTKEKRRKRERSNKPDVRKSEQDLDTSLNQ